jgi:hypothetical protein
VLFHSTDSLDFAAEGRFDAASVGWFDQIHCHIRRGVTTLALSRAEFGKFIVQATEKWAR